jgi:hypothetical protein
LAKPSARPETIASRSRAHDQHPGVVRGALERDLVLDGTPSEKTSTL